MEYIIMWLGTIVASTGMKSAVAIKLIKDIADCGYKMNINRLQEISSFINPVNVKLQKIINIIPVCNLFFALYIVIGTSNQRERIIDVMKTMGAIEYMSDEEQEEYNKNKSLLNAVRIMNESMEKKNIEDKNYVLNIKDLNLSVNKDGEKFIAKISISDDYKDFIIKEVSGTIESLSYDEQKEKIKFFLQRVVNNENEIEDKKEKWENVSKKISESVETKETDEKNIKEKLQKLRQEISQYTEEQNKNKDSKGKPYIKK